jgi:hypothetical protein
MKPDIICIHEYSIGPASLFVRSQSKAGSAAIDVAFCAGVMNRILGTDVYEMPTANLPRLVSDNPTLRIRVR